MSCLRTVGADTKIVVGNAGDHPLVLKLFIQAYQSPLAEDFQSRLDEPTYEPSDRLLLRRGEGLIGHVQISKQIGWFQGQRCPLARLQDFLTLPEYRAAGFDQPLIETAESIAQDEGGILAFVRTDQPEWFHAHGWSLCRGQGHSRANARAILSHFDHPQQSRRRKTSSLEVRTWRHFELDSIQHLYGKLAANIWGALHRNEETWQWLAGRKAHDQILIAVEGKTQKKKLALHSDKAVEQNNTPRVVGYAVVRDSCIVEMVTLPEYTAARAKLIARACRDAIERDHHFISLHTPATDPMHELLVTAGGSWISDGNSTGGNWMLKLLSPERWIERFYPVLHERAREADIPRPLEIDFAVGDTFQRLTLTRRSARLAQVSKISQPHLQCDWHIFQDLLTSNLAFSETVAQGKLRARDSSALRTVTALFPPQLFLAFPISVIATLSPDANWPNKLILAA